MKNILALLIITLWVVPVFAAEINTEIDMSHRGYDLGKPNVFINPDESPVFMPEVVNDLPGERIDTVLFTMGLGILTRADITYNGKDFERHTSPAMHITFQYFFTKCFGMGLSFSHMGGDTSKVKDFITVGDEYYLQYRYFNGALMGSFRYPFEKWEPYVNLGLTYDLVYVDEKNNATEEVDHKEQNGAVGGMAEIGIRYKLPSDINIAVSIKYNHTRNSFYEKDINFGGIQTYLSLGCYF